MIPTEEFVDPDAECHEVKPKVEPKVEPKKDAPAKVETAKTIPKDSNPVLEYLANERETLRKVRELDKPTNAAIWNAQVSALKKRGLSPNKPLSEYTEDEARSLVQFMYTKFDPMGTVLKDDGETA